MRASPSARLSFLLFLMAKGISSSDNAVIKAPADQRSYRLLHLPNGLTTVLVHDPDIFPEKLPDNSQTRETDDDEDEQDDEEDGDEDGDEEEEEEDDDEEEMGEEEGGGGKSKKGKDGPMPTKKVEFFSSWNLIVQLN